MLFYKLLLVCDAVCFACKCKPLTVEKVQGVLHCTTWFDRQVSIFHIYSGTVPYIFAGLCVLDDKK